MILFQVKAKHPPVISEGLNLFPCPIPWRWPTGVAVRTATSVQFPDTRTLASRAHQKGSSAHQSPIRLSEQHRCKNQIKLIRFVITTDRFRWRPLISFHKLIFIFSIPPHGSGAFPGASAVSSFLSSSLRPLFVRLVNARSWFYFPFAGPPAIPMVGAPGNTPEPSPSNEFR